MAFSGASVYACFLDVSTYRDLHVDVALVYEGLMFGSVAVAAFMQSRIALSRSQKGCSCIVDSTRKSLPPFPTAAVVVEGARGGEGLTDQPFPPSGGGCTEVRMCIARGPGGARGESTSDRLSILSPI